MKKAIGYVRVSTDKQENSVDMQPDKIRKYCEYNGIELVDIIVDEDVSGFTPINNRPGGNLISEMIKNKTINCVVTLKLDRLFRNTADALQTTELWNKKDIALHIVDMSGMSVDTSSAVGRMFITMMAGFSEMERTLISERTSAALQHRKSSKKTYGKTPFGYFVDVAGNLIESDDIEMVKAIYHLRSSGLGLNKISRKMNELQDVKVFYPSTIKCILENDIHKDLSF